MINACAVIITLNNWWSPCKICIPGADNSNLIKTEKAVPIIPANTANIRYNVPISLALVELSQAIGITVIGTPTLLVFASPCIRLNI